MYPQFLLADFSADVISGNTPLTVNFTNLTSGWPTGEHQMSHDWDYGDGSAHSSLLNPTHVYSLPGTYTVTLIETRDYIQDTIVKIDYITVSGEVVVKADFVGVPITGYLFLTVQFTDLSTGDFDSWYWSFGDKTYSTDQNPEHIYPHPGYFTVSLTVSGISGTYTETKLYYVSVTNTATYDFAPMPDEKMFLWGTGLVNKKDIGIELKPTPIGEIRDTGFVRDRGPTLIFD
jgi:PKD repeat protein